MVLRAGDPPAPIAARRGPYFDWIRREVGAAWPHEWAEHDLRADAPLPAPRAADGFIVTGSASSVTDRAAWMLAAADFLREVVRAETPLFGICFGHQMIADALGGEVTKNPRGREIGTVDVRMLAGADGDPILRGLGRSFRVNTTHLDTVTRLPEGARVLAETDLERHAVFVLGPSTKCVQFHPEIDADAMRGFVETRADQIRSEGGDPEAILAAVSDTPDGASTLRNFVLHVVR